MKLWIQGKNHEVQPVVVVLIFMFCVGCLGFLMADGIAFENKMVTAVQQIQYRPYQDQIVLKTDYHHVLTSHSRDDYTFLIPKGSVIYWKSDLLVMVVRESAQQLPLLGSKVLYINDQYFYAFAMIDSIYWESVRRPSQKIDPVNVRLIE